MKNLRINKNLVAIIVTLAFSIWLIKSLDRNTVIKLLDNISPLWIGIGSFFYIVVYFVKVARWKALLPMSSGSFKDMLGITGIHNLAVRIFPNPAGELVFLRQAKQINIAYSDSLAALTINRALDFVFVGFFFLFGVTPFFLNPTKAIFFFLSVSIFFIAGGIGLIIFLSSAPNAAKKTVKIFFSLFLPTKFEKKIEQKTDQFLNAFAHLKNRKIYFKAVFFSFVLWLSMFGAYFFFLKGFGINLKLNAVFAGGAVQIFANTIPNIGGFGIMEAGWVAGLNLAEIENQTAIAGALAVDLMTLVGTIIFGLIAFLIQKGKLLIKNN
ncbi:MAG: lysylphosphatidylglycerol synthase transmembrane domain-containing protein [Patescibacteria group bacterium]